MEQNDFDILAEIKSQPKTAIMLIGIHCTGKTYFYHEYLKDLARVEYDGKIKRKQQQQIVNFINDGMSFVLDNTNITKADRKPILELFKNKGYRICAMYFCSVVKECIEKNRKRLNHIPDKKIIDMSKIIEMPNASEGFTNVYYVDNAQNDFYLEVWE